MKGVYVLIIEVSRDIDVKIGSLGEVRFEKGLYAYAGSGQNSLFKRIERHLSDEKKIFWHVDYLLDCGFSKVARVFYKEGPKSLECRTAAQLSEYGIGVPGFGCSDCKCGAHLFKISSLGYVSRLGMDEYCLSREV